MMQNVLLAIFIFVETQCEISKVLDKTGNTSTFSAIKKDDLEFWKPDLDLNELLPLTTRKQRQLTKNDKPIFRHNIIKKHEAKSKWPKILQKTTKKAAARSTKMHLMQEEETTIIQLSDSYERNESAISENLSSYSIKQQLEKISEYIPHSNVTLEVIGRTKEYQDIVLLKITKEKEKYFRADDDKYADDSPQKKIIFIVHGLSVMGIRTLQCLSWTPSLLTLVSYYVEHLDKFDIFLIPMANPDGYAFVQILATLSPSQLILTDYTKGMFRYTLRALFSALTGEKFVPLWTDSILPQYLRPNNQNIWNKNVAPQTECAGVALDRNFDVAWGNNRSISSCSQEFPGVVPFSEAETRAIRDIFHKYSHKIIAYLNVHAGTYGSETFKGDAVLYPKGYTDSITDEDKYIDLKGEIDEAIRNASFQVYSVAVETLFNWYGKVSGSSVDYASTVYGIPFALELVMQLYDDVNSDGETVNFQESALTQVWRRVIDVIFTYIWKSTNKGNEVR